MKYKSSDQQEDVRVGSSVPMQFFQKVLNEAGEHQSMSVVETQSSLVLLMLSHAWSKSELHIDLFTAPCRTRREPDPLAIHAESWLLLQAARFFCNADAQGSSMQGLQ